MAPRPPRDPGARAAALTLLEKVDSGRGHAAALLAALPARMPARDRALATELVNGVLRRRSHLDRMIGRVATRPIAAIDAPLLAAIRLALYQILFLSRIPAPAAVDESVVLARRRQGRSAAAFANAVLRRACRIVASEGREAALRVDPDLPEVLRLAETHSFPAFLAGRFVARLGGAEAGALMESMNRPAPLVLRPTRRAGDEGGLVRRLAEEGIAIIPSPILSGALRVTEGAPQATRVFQEGQVYIQDEAAQMVALLLEPLPGSARVLDLCAAPGGKTLAIADRLPDGPGFIVAADLSRARLRRLDENLERIGSRRILRVVSDAEHPALRRGYDRVLIDAPCSGTGIIRRHPEIRWRRTPDAIATFARRQAALLRKAVDLAAPGGHVVYAVCSLEPEEGPAQIESLLADRTDLALVDARTILPAALHRFVDGRGCLVTLPHRDDIDGFFAAVLRIS